MGTAPTPFRELLLLRVTLTLGAGLVLHAVSCARETEPIATTVLTAARPLMNDDAAFRLTRARCDRADACGHVGPGQRFADGDACVRELWPSARAHLAPTACPRGVDAAELRECLDDVGAQRCESVFDPNALPACARLELCAGGGP